MHKKLRSVNIYYQGKLSLRCLAYHFHPVVLIAYYFLKIKKTKQKQLTSGSDSQISQ